MESLTKIFTKNDHTMIKQLSQSLKSKHIEFMFKNIKEVEEIIQNYLNLLLKKPGNLKDKDWELACYLSFVFVIIFEVDPAKIPNISLFQQSGRLFSASLNLKVKQTLLNEGSPHIMSYLEEYYKQAKSGFNITTFYSTTPCFYLLPVSNYISMDMGTDKSTHRIEEFFKIISQISRTKNSIHYSNLLFIAETISNILKSKIPLPVEYIQVFNAIFQEMIKCPSTGLVLFFSNWLNFIKQINNQYQMQNNQRLLYTNTIFPQSELVSQLFSLASRYKYNEMITSFSWNYIYYYADLVFSEDQFPQQLRIINMISSIQKRVSRTEIFPYINDSITRFSGTLTETYKKKGPSCHIFTLITALEQSIESLVAELNELQPIYLQSPNKPNPDEKVYFIDQICSSNNYTQYDKELYTIVHYKVFTSAELADAYHKKQLAKVDEIKSKLNSIAFYYFQLKPKLINLYIAESKLDSNSQQGYLFNYIISFIFTWVKFMILACYKLMCLSLYKPSSNENFLPSRPERHHQYDLTNTFQKIILSFQELPSSSYKMIASVIVALIVHFSNDRMITLPFINILDKLSRERNQNDPPDSYTIIAYVVAMMMSLTYEKVHTFNSRSFLKSHLFYLWSLLTFRIGTPKETGASNTFFGSLTLFYFKVIVTAIFSNTKWMTNQSTALKTAQDFIDAEMNLHPELPQRKGRNSRMHSRIISFDDIRDSAKEQAACAFLDYFSQEADAEAIDIFMPAFETALKSNNPQTVIKAAKICHKFIVGDLPNTWVEESNDARKEFFYSYFKSLSVLDSETAKEVIEDATILTPMFLQPQFSPSFILMVKIPDLLFNLSVIMQQLSLHANENDDDYRNIFAFLTNVFDFIYNNISIERQHLQPIVKSAVFLLLQCFAFDSFFQTVNGYVNHLNSLFAPFFARGDFDLYFLCTLSVVGANRSDIAQIATDILVSFLDTVKHYGITEKVVDKTIVTILAYFSPQTHMFSILTGLSLLNRFFPGCIMLDYVRSLLVQLTDMPASETHFFNVLGEFLKNWLSMQTPETHKEFVMMIYDIVCPLSTPVRIVLHQQTEKLNVKIPIHSMAEIDTADDVLYLERISLVIGCGVEFDFVLTPGIIQRITEIICKKSEGITILEHISHSLQLTLSSIHHREFIHEFSQNEVLLSQILNHICNSLTSHYTPVLYLAKKCIQEIKNLYGGELRFSQQIYEYCWSPEKIFTPFGPQPERIGFYRRLTKLLPDKASITIVDIFTNAIVEFENKSNAQKLKYMQNFIQFIKMFTVRELMSIDIIHEKVCHASSNGQSNLQLIIDIFLKLMNNPEIPFYALTKKYVVKLVRNFADEVVQYIMFSHHHLNVSAIYFLQVCIFNDSTGIILKAMERLLMGLDDLNCVNPSISKMIMMLVVSIWSNEQKILLLNSAVRLFNFYLDSCKDERKPGNHRFAILSDITTAVVYLIDLHFDKQLILRVAEAFEQPILMDTSTYHKFVKIVFDTKSPEFKVELFNDVYNMRNNLSNFVVTMMLSHCIMKTQHTKENLEDFLEKLLLISKDEIFRTAVIRSIYHILRQYMPSDDKLKQIILDPLKASITSPNPEQVIYGIRVSTILQKKNKLPTVVFKGFVLTLLTYTKFLEPPYFKFLVKLIKHGLKNIEDDPNDYISAISYYFVDKNLNIHDYINVGNFLVQVPYLLDLLPFSFIGFMTDQLSNRIHDRKQRDDYSDPERKFKQERGKKLYSKQKEDILEANEIINFLHKCMAAVQATQEEFEHYVEVTFPFISMLSQQIMKKDPYESFYMLLANANYKLTKPFNLLGSIIQGPLTSFSFGFICVSVKFVKDEEMEAMNEFVERVLRYLVDEKNHVNGKLFAIFCARVFTKNDISQQLYNLAVATLDELINKMKNDKRFIDIVGERAMILINSLLKFNYDEEIERRLMEFFEFIGIIAEIKPFNNVGVMLVRNMLKCIETIFFGEQNKLITLLLDKIIIYHDAIRSYADLLAQILRSPHISPICKENLVEKFPIILKDQPPETIQRVIDYIPDELNSVSLNLRIHLILAKQLSPTYRIEMLDKIRSSLPEDPAKSIVVLCKSLTYEYWTDEFVPLIIALLAKKVSMWQPLFALSSYFISIGSELCYPTLQQIINEENIDSLRDLYSYLVSKCENAKLSQMINGISRAFLYRGFSLLSNTVQFAASITGEFDTLVAFTSREKINLTYLMPHRQNDTIFGLLRPTLSLREAAAMSLTILGQYEAAGNLYSEVEMNPIISQVRDINNQLNISENPTNILEIIRPLIQVDLKADIIVESLIKASKLSFKGLKEPTINFIDMAESAIIETIKNQFYISIFQKERIITISNILLFLKQRVLGKPTLTFPDELDVTCINPSFFRVINAFTSILSKTPMKNPPLESNSGEALFMVENSMSKKFSTIIGYDSRGLVGIGEAQITEYFAQIQNLVEQDKLKVNDLKQFAPFTYMFYELVQTPEAFHTAFTSYKNILSSTEQIPMYILHAAAARIITLVRFAVNQNDPSLIQTVEAAADLFSTEQAVIWCVWLQQIVELSRAPWFFEIVYHLFNDMSYRSTLYGEKLGIPEFKDLLQKRVMHSVTTQIVMMDILSGFVNTFLKIDFGDYVRMKSFIFLARELSKLSPDQIQTLDLIEIRKRHPIPWTLLEKAVSAFTLNEIAQIDVQSLYNLAVANDTCALMKFIAEATNSTTQLNEYNDMLSNSIADVNKNLPFIISVKFDNYPHISIIRIHDDFNIIDNDIFVMHATTSVSPRMTFLIQKSKNENGFHQSVLTLSSIFVFFKQMMECSYQSKIRAIRMDASSVFEIGKNLMLSSLPGDVISLESLFRMVTGKTKEEWLEENTTNGELNERGRETIKTQETQSFREYMLTEMAQTATSALRPNILRSFAAHSLVGEIFSSAYPILGHMIFCCTSAIMPTVHVDFDARKTPESSSFRLSPNVLSSIGPTGPGELTVALAACANALAENLECVRSFLEVVIGDRDVENHSIEAIKEKRQEMESVLMNIAPPRGHNVDLSDAENWISGIEELIHKATVPEIQPLEAVPWF